MVFARTRAHNYPTYKGPWVHVRRGAARLIGIVAVAAAVGLAFAGCTLGKPQPTLRLVYVTVTPTAGPTDTPAPAVTDSPTPDATATPGPSATATATAVPSASAGLTAPPPSKPIPASTCTLRGAKTSTFWAVAAKPMDWVVYCPILPAPWAVSGDGYNLSVGARGVVWVAYSSSHKATLRIDEGSFCTTTVAKCSPGTVLKPALFGDQLGSLVDLPGGNMAIYVNPGASKSYRLTGSGMSEAAFIQIAQDLARIARP